LSKGPPTGNSNTGHSSGGGNGGSGGSGGSGKDSLPAGQPSGGPTTPAHPNARPSNSTGDHPKAPQHPSSSPSNAAGGTASQDPCYVHVDCEVGLEWVDQGRNGGGQGYYCKDGKTVDCNKDGACDTCQIHTDCSTGANWNADKWLWECST